MPLYRLIDQQAQLLEHKCVPFADGLLYQDLLRKDSTQGTSLKRARLWHHLQQHCRADRQLPQNGRLCAAISTIAAAMPVAKIPRMMRLVERLSQWIMAMVRA